MADPFVHENGGRVGYNGRMDVGDVRADLLAEQQSLDDIVAPLADDDWRIPTPSPGWSVADQIGHLTYFDGTATLAISDADAFAESMAELLRAADGDAITLAVARSGTPSRLLAAWRSNRNVLADASATLRDGDRVPWYGPSMGAKSFLTARLMETWAHGQDIVDTIGATRPPTDRLRHVANLGVITRGWTYANRQLEVPSTPVRVELTSPTGETWVFGPDDADESIVGPAEDFCLVTTQRRHVDDTSLLVSGSAAADWMAKAQLFAGPPTDGPPPRR